MFCPYCGKENDDRVSFCQSCGRRIGGLSLYAGVEAPRWAGFWRRFAASILDGIVLTVGGLILGVVVGIAFWYSDLSEYVVLFYGFLLEWIYFAAMESSARQATIGKMALGIVVTDNQGRRISFGRATARHFSKIASALTFGMGFILAGFTRKKQALHDIIAGCLVVEKEPEGRYSSYPGRPVAPS